MYPVATLRSCSLLPCWPGSSVVTSAASPSGLLKKLAPRSMCCASGSAEASSSSADGGASAECFACFVLLTVSGRGAVDSGSRPCEEPAGPADQLLDIRPPFNRTLNVSSALALPAAIREVHASLTSSARIQVWSWQISLRCVCHSQDGETNLVLLR